MEGTFTYQSYSNPLEKDLFKQPPTALEIAFFLTPPPPPRNFHCPSWGIMDIFCNYTLHLPKGGRSGIKEF